MVALCLLGGGGWFAYQQIFTKGLDELPPKVCDKAVDREAVVRVLPDTRSADEEAKPTGAGKNFALNCRIYTSGDSILSGEAKIQDASEQSWINFYGGKVNDRIIRVSTDGVAALAQRDNAHATASVYVACTPRGVQAADASESYALITEARVVGDTRVTDAALRQAVTDFAYQLTKRAYELGECQNTRTLPDELPRYKSG